MKKFLDILLVFSITFLIFSLFLSPKQDEQRNELNIIFEKNSYTIPASIKILVQNHTSSGFIIDTCRDISISKSGERIEFSPEFCEEREIKA
ncbi:MAG: hypothetical protein LBF15_02410 [Candidatus Peribacteria bacterium]|jgi:hypothetical protein|nr:hypothetical protein [Candidatus Peribacteria bacterium]